MKLPKFITFTGVDSLTDPDAMARLACQYPIEWGVLFSPARQGTSPRYPGDIKKFLNHPALNLSAHLCGQHSDRVLRTQSCSLDSMIAEHFDRAQINTRNAAHLDSLHTWGARLNVGVILQTRSSFPLDSQVSWLYDCSGGRGEVPSGWPPVPPRMSKTLHGFAGGLNPANVRKHVELIGAVDHEYWIDMETGVRDREDRFSLELCRQVCQEVYGDPP